MTNSPPGRLYVVATPIGNRGDLSPRALETLEGVDAIAAEDTRHTANLLRHLGVRTPLLSYHEHSGENRAREILARLAAGERIALVSDAGTPTISDPGHDLVRAALDAGIEVVAVPGACAAIAALSIAGLPTDRFCFEGFLPARAGARRARLEALATEQRTLVLYEAPHRIAETLVDCGHVLGESRRAVVARETTKLHETLYRGSLAELAARAAAEPDFSRGELVLVVAGGEPPAGGEADGELARVLGVLLEELPLRQAAHLAARLTGTRENDAYRRALDLKRCRDAD